MTSEKELAHIGVKGMKWGVRKNRNSSSVAKPDHSVSRKGQLKTLSNEELTKRIRRLQLETQYKDLSKKSASKSSQFIQARGKRALAAVGDKVTDMAVKAALSGAGDYLRRR